MNIVKSIIVMGILYISVCLSVYSLIKCAIMYRQKMAKRIHIVTALLIICIMVLGIVFLGDYVYPFERVLEPVLYAEIIVPEEYVLDYPGQKFWHGAYEQYGLHAESFYFDPDDPNSIYGFGWPPMDFKHHSYIFTYVQKIDYISYNVWETIDEPIRTGAKVGHMILDEEFSPEKVYIYQIPKIRIENDINDTSSVWD